MQREISSNIVKQAQAAFASKRFKDAIKMAERINDQDVNFSEAQYLTGSALVVEGDIDSGIDAMGKAVAHAPQTLKYQIGLAATLMMAKKRKDALTVLEGTIAVIREEDFEIRRSTSELLLALCGQLSVKNDFENAILAARFASNICVDGKQEITAHVDFLQSIYEMHQYRERERRLCKESETGKDWEANAQHFSNIHTSTKVMRNMQSPLLARQSPYLNFPEIVQVETLAVCNAACTFCPYPELERQGQRMPDKIVAKIISDLEKIPREHAFLFEPYRINEPFIDKRLIKLLRTVNERLPNATIAINSNGSVMTKKHIDGLDKVSKVNLNISLNDHRKSEYESLMRIPFDRTADKLSTLHRHKENGAFRHKVSLSRVMDGTPADRDFLAYCGTTYPLFDARLMTRQTWLGQSRARPSLPTIPDLGCKHWASLVIAATGKVSICCMDAQDQWPIGDIRTSSVLEIYNSPRFRQLREKAMSRKKALPPCDTCTEI